MRRAPRRRQLVLRARRARPAATSRRSRTRRDARRRAPRAARRGAAPPAEWMNAARRMSESLTTSRSTVARNASRLAAAARPRHRCVEHARRHRAIAIDDLAVELQLFGEVGQHGFGRRIVRRGEPRRGFVPRARRALPRAPRGEQRAHFALEPQHVLAQPLAFEPVRRDLLQHLVDDRRERAQRAGAGTAVDQHQRKVVAQPREIAVAREERGPQSASPSIASTPSPCRLPVEKNRRCS